MARGRNSTATGVRFNDGLLLELRKLAQSQGLTTNEFIVRLVEHGLECSGHPVVEHQVWAVLPLSVGESIGALAGESIGAEAGESIRARAREEI